MSLMLTLSLLAAALVVTVFANWQERQERPLGRPSLVPYPILQVIAVVLVILLIAHLISLFTGHPLRGRRMP